MSVEETRVLIMGSNINLHFTGSSKWNLCYKQMHLRTLWQIYPQVF